MYILKNFPQMSETYIKTEIEAVRERCEIAVVATKKANLPAKNHVPFRQIEDLSVIRELIKEFRPHVLHSHWLHSAKLLGKLASKINVPFTVSIIAMLHGIPCGPIPVGSFTGSAQLCAASGAPPWDCSTLATVATGSQVAPELVET